MRILLGSGVRRGTLAAGKAAGLSLGLAVLVVPAAAAGALALTLGTDAEQAASPLRVALLAAAYLLYFAGILGVTLAVSTWARSSRGALLTLLGLWIVNALVSPRVASDVAGTLHPLPSAESFRATISEELRNGVDGHSPQDARQQALRDSVLAAYGAQTLEELPVNYAGISLQASEEYANRVYDRHFGALASTMLAQEDVHRTLGLATPMLAVRSASMGLSGTDVFHHEQFVRAAEEHRRLIQRILNRDIEQNSRFGETYTVGEEVWATVPEFQYDAPTLAAVLSREAPSFVILVAWVLLSGVAFGLGMRRVSPE
jgi:ABC-2 type transport system permease protein